MSTTIGQSTEAWVTVDESHRDHAYVVDRNVYLKLRELLY